MVSRPTIYITKMTPQTELSHLLYGMEEEEIPGELKENQQLDLIAAAYEQALKSPLEVGIAVNEKQAVLHFKSLPEKEPLFVVDNNEESMMTLGKNAARLVKGIPFKLDV